MNKSDICGSQVGRLTVCSCLAVLEAVDGGGLDSGCSCCLLVCWIRGCLSSSHSPHRKPNLRAASPPRHSLEFVWDAIAIRLIRIDPP